MLRNQKQNRKRLSVSIVMGLCALAITGTIMGDIQSGTTIVDLRINETLPMNSQPPKSPLSGGL